MNDNKSGVSASFSPSSSSIFAIDNQSSDIVKKIKSGQFKVAVYGLGHIGSSIASVWLRAGAHVIGVDKSSKVLENAKRGKTHVPEPGVNDAFTKGLEEKRFQDRKSTRLNSSHGYISYAVFCL